MIGDGIYRPALVSSTILCVISNSHITHRVVTTCIGALEKRGDSNGRVRLYLPYSAIILRFVSPFFF